MNLQTETLASAVGAASIGGESHNKQKWQKVNLVANDALGDYKMLDDIRFLMIGRLEELDIEDEVISEKDRENDDLTHADRLDRGLLGCPGPP